ncbi:MAG: hypothetical protein DRI90_11790 [Deltaproteobacteria bacterium]|nr:MAG: hypothetical protein DRI90_11790 [Deltaproteobacteria bacterium]
MTVTRVLAMWVGGMISSTTGLAAVVCSSSDDWTAPTQPTLTDEEASFAQELSQTVCASVGDCCGQAGVELDPFCEHNGTDQLRAELLQSKVGGGSFDGTAAATCLAAWQTALSDCDLQPTQRSELLAACRGVFAGLAPPGEACTDDGQCQHPAGGFALCAEGGVAAGRCDQGQCTEHCDPPTQPFVTWKTCDGSEQLDGYCHDQCYYPQTDSACMMVCWCCVDNGNQTCEFTAFQTAELHERHLCTGGHYSIECGQAEQQAHHYCDTW